MDLAALMSQLDARELPLVQQIFAFGQDNIWLTYLSYMAGEIAIYVMAAIMAWLWWKAQPARAHHGNRKAVVLALLSAVFVIAIKTVIATIIFRERPFVLDPSLLISGVHVDPVSFPSAHSMVAATIAASLTFSKVKHVSFWLILLAVIVGIGRVLIGVHYPSDVVVGWVIGVVVAWLLHRESGSLKQYLPNA